MEEIKLYSEFVNGSKNKKDLLTLKKIIEEMIKLYKDGKPIYIKILTGERKGSIAKFIPERKMSVELEFSTMFDPVWKLTHDLSGHLIWDGRKNKIQYYIYPNWTAKESWLKDYDGPTIYKKYDKKKAVKDLLKNPNQKDIDGNILKVGDEVVYANIRYGSGTKLCHGIIDRFEAQSYIDDYNDKEYGSVFTIVRMHNSDEESKIECSEYLIVKIT